MSKTKQVKSDPTKAVRKILARVKAVTKRDLAHKSVFELLASAGEELGELSNAVLIEQKTFGRTHRKLPEPARSEAADLALCGLSMYFATGGKSVSKLFEVLDEKLAKWEASKPDESEKRKKRKKRNKAKGS